MKKCGLVFHPGQAGTMESIVRIKQVNAQEFLALRVAVTAQGLFQRAQGSAPTLPGFKPYSGDVTIL